MRRIGKECIRTEHCREKVKAWVKKYYRVTYADPKAEQEAGYADIRKTPTPAPQLLHSYASASVVTDVMIRSYCRSLKRLGIEYTISESTQLYENKQMCLETYFQTFLPDHS